MASPKSKIGSVHADSSEDAAINQQSNSALMNARRNFRYLVNPASSDKPGRVRTRALLRTVRYISVFIFWRVIRWAKYAAVGALIAAVSATAVGGFVSGFGWLLAPPSIGASVIAMGVWTTGKFAANRLQRRWQRSGIDAGEAQRDQSHNSVITAGRLGPEVGPQAVPW